MEFFAALDLDLARWFSAVAREHPLVYATAIILAVNNLPKTGVLLALWWGLWFQRSADHRRRLVLLSAWIAAPCAALSSRLLAGTLFPFRDRPIDSPGIYSPVPGGLTPDFGAAPSSLPSDHAALVSALILGLWLAHRRWGAVAVIYALIAILLPRIFLGFHYLTDVIAGLLVGGTVFVLVFSLCKPLDAALRGALRRPGLLYPLLFLGSWQITVLFVPLLDLARFFGLVWSGLTA